MIRAVKSSEYLKPSSLTIPLVNYFNQKIVVEGISATTTKSIYRLSVPAK